MITLYPCYFWKQFSDPVSLHLPPLMCSLTFVITRIIWLCTNGTLLHCGTTLLLCFVTCHKSVFKAPLMNLQQLKNKVFKNSTGLQSWFFWNLDFFAYIFNNKNCIVIFLNCTTVQLFQKVNTISNSLRNSGFSSGFKMIKVFKGFRNPKKGGHRHFFKKTPGNHQGVGIW